MNAEAVGFAVGLKVMGERSGTWHAKDSGELGFVVCHSLAGLEWARPRPIPEPSWPMWRGCLERPEPRANNLRAWFPVPPVNQLGPYALPQSYVTLPNACLEQTYVCTWIIMWVGTLMVFLHEIPTKSCTHTNELPRSTCSIHSFILNINPWSEPKYQTAVS